VEPSPDPTAARWFARHVLPADPLLARGIAACLTREQVTPAHPPLSATAGEPDPAATPPAGSPA
jgi:hypothetical protein